MTIVAAVGANGRGSSAAPPAPDAQVPSGPVAHALWDTVSNGAMPLLVVSRRHRGAVPDEPLCAWANRAAAPLFAREASDVAGLAVRGMLTPLDASPDGDYLDRLLQPTRSATMQLGARRADGSWQSVTVVAQPTCLPEPDGRGWWTLALSTDSSRGMQELLDASQQRFVALAQRTPIATMMSEVGARLAYVNDAFVELVGASAESLLGMGWLDHVYEEDRAATLSTVQRTLVGGSTQTHVRLVTADGDIRRVELRLAPVAGVGAASGFVGTVEDVTDRLALQERLNQQARHDPLTGLVNRTHLWDYLVASMGTAGLAVLFLDLDNFKVINDSLGHDAGDAMLVQIAARLRASTRTRDAVARFGGDEFVVVCPGMHSVGSAAAMADRLLEAVTAPLTVGAVTMRPSASIGVVLRGPEHTSPQDLLRDADIAMYQAKRAGKNRYALCDDEARDSAREELRLVSDLQWALEGRRLQVVYQPVVEMMTGRLVSVEALVRWNHPLRGFVSPETFVGLAERHGLIGALTRQVMGRACADMDTWRRELGPVAPSQVHVNVSPVQLAGDEIPELVADALASHDLPPGALCLEITEGALMSEPGAALETLGRLHASGISLAVDDFGTGQSSLAYLCHLPVDCLKIDRSFVAGLPERRPRSVAAAVVSLSESLGLQVIAEGVEEPDQAMCLHDMGCRLAQGWLFARPLPAAALGDWARAARDEPLAWVVDP